MKTRLLGFELYFEDLGAAREFYLNLLGLGLVEDQPDHHAKFEGGAGFLCLERKGMESYPSLDKAVVFIEVDDLASRLAGLGNRVLQTGSSPGETQPSWAVLHDPEGHNVVLFQARPKSWQ
jgi:predicted enzyme related to lactoylglutathione lyase